MSLERLVKVERSITYHAVRRDARVNWVLELNMCVVLSFRGCQERGKDHALADMTPATAIWRCGILGASNFRVTFFARSPEMIQER
jgi:hypothetical protein